MKMRTSAQISLAMVAMAFAFTALMWGRLPETMPVHFGPGGVADRFGSRWEGALLMPLVMVGLSAVFAVLPALSPKGFEIGFRDQALGAFRVAILGFLLLIHGELLHAAARGGQLSEGVVGVGLGLLFCVLGNWMGKVRRNFFMGVRTPWTLADAEVWDRTHRLAGRLFVAAGLLVVTTALVSAPAVFVWVAALGVAAVVPAGYSYVLYRRLHPRQDGV
jgi:uncharacterized membrane protein